MEIPEQYLRQLEERLAKLESDLAASRAGQVSSQVTDYLTMREDGGVHAQLEEHKMLIDELIAAVFQSDPNDSPDGVGGGTITLSMGTTSADSTTYDASSGKNLVIEIGTHYIDTSSKKTYLRKRVLTLPLMPGMSCTEETSVVEVDGDADCDS